MKIVDYYCLNKKKMISLLTKHLSKQWEWDRISFVDKSILLTAVSEFNTNKIDKKIIIDQALINAKFYSDVASIKFINAILDKVLI
jgi:transcription termination factor NusB